MVGIALRKRVPYCRLYASHSLIPAILATAYHSFVDSSGPYEQIESVDASWQQFHVISDQIAALQEDVQKVRSHPLIPDTVKVGGFLYYVDTGLIDQKF